MGAMSVWQSLVDWLYSWGPILSQLEPLAKIIGTVFAIIVTGASSYSAMVIKSLQQQTQRMSQEISALRRERDEAFQQSAAHWAADDLIEMLRRSGHRKLHVAPEIPSKAAREARRFPSVLDQKLIGLIDGGFWMNRDNVAAFTIDGIHLAEQQQPISWEELAQIKVEKRGDTLLLGDKEQGRTLGSLDEDHAFYAKLQQFLRSYLSTGVEVTPGKRVA